MMFWDDAEFQRRKSDTLIAKYHYAEYIKPLFVDFYQPWWKILWDQKNLFGVVIVAQTLFTAFESVFPFFLGLVISSHNYGFLSLLISIRLLSSVIYNAIQYHNLILYVKTEISIEYWANVFFLTVDPIYHATKSTGQIISKVDRGATSWEELLDVTVFELIPTIVGIITVTITMTQYSWILGIETLICMVAIGCFSVFQNIYRNKIFEKKHIDSEDARKSMSIENLQQAPFIRSLFATPHQAKKIQSQVIETGIIRASGWRLTDKYTLITKSLLILSVGAISWQIMRLVDAGSVDIVIALSLITTFIYGTGSVTRVGNFTKRLAKSLTHINDLFLFIRSFGAQSYPVLEDIIDN
jgi:ABC-type multidrug transport system fused ATPase/permease subunit